MYLSDPASHIEHCKRTGQWEEVVSHYQFQVLQGHTNFIPDLTNALKNCCLYEVPLMYDTEINESQFECLWRLGRWNENRSNIAKQRGRANNFEELRYVALKSLHDEDRFTFSNVLKIARLYIINRLAHASLESCKNLYVPLSQLQALQELEDFASAKESGNFDALFEKWKLQDSINRNEFQYVEPMMAQRIAMVHEYVKYHNGEALKSKLIQLYLELTGKKFAKFCYSFYIAICRNGET